MLNSVYRYALSPCNNSHDAEDLTQDAWLRLNSRYGKSPNPAILFATIRNRFFDSCRKERVENRYRQELQHSGTDSIEHINQDILAERALQHSLGDAEGEALFLSVVAGYTENEIAELTQKNRGTILSLIHRAKIKLKERYLELIYQQTPLKRHQLH